jgi:hypothetical protein
MTTFSYDVIVVGASLGGVAAASAVIARCLHRCIRIRCQEEFAAQAKNAIALASSVGLDFRVMGFGYNRVDPIYS